MYGTDYWKRADIQQICEFIRSGSGDIEIEKGTPEERHLRNGKALGEGVRLFRDRILKFDWDNIADDEIQKQMKTEEMFDDTLLTIGNINQLAYEIGFITGIKIGKDIFQIAQSEDKSPSV